MFFFDSGYMSPEYALDGQFSTKSDVFSFGVVLLEIISGKKNTGFYQSKEISSLLGYASFIYIYHSIFFFYFNFLYYSVMIFFLLPGLETLDRGQVAGFDGHIST